MITILRFILGLLFAFSGFVKAVDPQGTEIKISEYLDAFGLASVLPDWLPILGSLLLACAEFMIGICLLVNYQPKTFSLLSLLFMVVMTPMTLWLAIDNPVSDCGCFGDAVVLTNWQTFWKNVFLLVCAISLYIYLKCVITQPWCHAKALLPLLALLSVIGVQYYALHYLPLIDFRPYRVGADIRAGMIVPDDAERPVYATEMVFERNGERRSFSLEDYPDSTWQYVSTEVRLVKAGYQAPIHDFSIVEAMSHDDVTDRILSLERVYLVLSPDLKKADTVSASPINELYKYCLSENIPFYFITASTEEAFREWKNVTHAQYPYYQMDGTTIKTMIRANPGVMELRRGVVTNKWNAKTLSFPLKEGEPALP